MLQAHDEEMRSASHTSSQSPTASSGEEETPSTGSESTGKKRARQALGSDDLSSADNSKNDTAFHSTEYKEFMKEKTVFFKRTKHSTRSNTDEKEKIITNELRNK